MKFHEHFNRSLAKAISYRILMLTSDSIILFLLTRRWDVTIGVITFSNLASTFLYIAHERVWNKIHWGRGPRKK